MSDKVHQLHAVPPLRVADNVREGIIKELERTLEEARAGDIREILMIVVHRDQTLWSQRTSNTGSILTWLGRLEVTKQDWIEKLGKAEEDTL